MLQLLVLQMQTCLLLHTWFIYKSTSEFQSVEIWVSSTQKSLIELILQLYECCHFTEWTFQKLSFLLAMEIYLFQIKYKISRVRRKFGAPITFTDKNASDDKDSYAECTSYEDNTFSIKMIERDVGVQTVPKVRETSTQTKW